MSAAGTVALVDYGAGNLRSVQNTLAELGTEYTLVRDAAGLRGASKIILPGVGHFGQMMRSLDEMGVRETFIERIGAGVPFLGICLGLQALFESSEFFDPEDVLQVKYEMLRLVNVDKRPISEAAKACGFSRPSFYQAQVAFEQGGLAALIAHKPGPHGGHKLTPAVLQFVIEARTADPGVRSERLAERVHQRYGVHVHPRSIERQLLRKKKRR